MEVDYNEIRAEYIRGNLSYRKIAEKYGVPLSNLTRIAIKEKWYEQRKQAVSKATAKFVNDTAKEMADKAFKVNQTANRLLDKIFDTLDALDFIDGKSAKGYSGAIRDIQQIKGLKADMDLKEQKLRIKKLEKELESNQQELVTGGIVLMPAILPDLSPPTEDDGEDENADE